MCILAVKFRTNGHSNSSRYWNFSRPLRASPTAPKYALNFFHDTCPERASIRPWTSSSMSIDTSHLIGGGRSHQRMHNTNKSNDKKRDNLESDKKGKLAMPLQYSCWSWRIRSCYLFSIVIHTIHGVKWRHKSLLSRSPFCRYKCVE